MHRLIEFLRLHRHAGAQYMAVVASAGAASRDVPLLRPGRPADLPCPASWQAGRGAAV